MGSLRWARNRWRGYSRLPQGERRLACEAALLLPLTALSLRLLGLNRTRALLVAASAHNRFVPIDLRRTDGDVASESTSNAAIRTAAVVAAVVRRLPCGGNCLERSLTLWCLLRGQGIESDLRVGVRTSAGSIEAHAWVEHEGEVLNDRVDVALRYPPFAGAVLP